MVCILWGLSEGWEKKINMREIQKKEKETKNEWKMMLMWSGKTDSELHLCLDIESM